MKTDTLSWRLAGPMVIGIALAGLLFFSARVTEDDTRAYAYPPPASPTPTAPAKLVHLATSAAFSNTVAVIRDAGSALWYSPVCGACWRPFQTSPSSVTASQIAVAPRADGRPRFLVAVKGEGVYRTGDAGQSWALQIFSHPGQCTEPDQFENLVASPRDPQRLYVTRYCYYDDGMASTGYYSVYTSPDSGLSWQMIRGGGPEVWLGITPSPLLANRVYVMNGAGQWYRSDTAGQTWAPQNYPVLTLALDPQNSNWLYGLAAVGKRSIDNGVTWSDWKQTPCPAAANTMPLLAHPTQTGVLFLRCDQGLYRSTNAGDNWEQLSATPGDFLVADRERPGRLFWAKSGGLWASEDAGTTWKLLVAAWDQLSTCLSVFFSLVGR